MRLLSCVCHIMGLQTITFLLICHNKCRGEALVLYLSSGVTLDCCCLWIICNSQSRFLSIVGHIMLIKIDSFLWIICHIQSKSGACVSLCCRCVWIICNNQSYYYVLVIWCLFILLVFVNNLSQKMQLWGISTVWVILCFFRLLVAMN